MGVGAQHCPLGLHALWGLRAAGVVGGRPRGGWPATVVRGVWCQALSLPRPPVLWSGQPGFRDPCVPGAFGAGVGTQHRPHSVHPCGPALLAVGVAEGRPRGGCLHHCEGRLRSGAVPPPTARPLGGLLGSATHVLWARVCGCGGPTLSPWPACPVGAACRGGGGGPSQGGLACHRCEGRLVSGAVPPPAARPLERAARVSATRLSQVRSVRAWGPSTGPTACALAGRRCSLWGWRKGVPGGGAFHHCEGRLLSGAVPPPAARPLERVARVPRPVCPKCGRCGRGDPAPAPHRAPLRAGATHCGGGGRASPGGVSFHHCEGRLRSGAVPPPTARPLGGLLGSATHVLWARVCGCGGPTLSPWPACPAGAASREAGGGPSPGGLACHRCEGRLVSGAVPPPAARPLERAARVPRPVCPGCGRCGRGDPAPALQRAPLRAGVAHCGAGGRASPGGVPSTIMRGV